MPIHLISGLPGNGKTALAVEHLLQQAAKAERPLFAFGIDGLKLGLATIMKDPTQWNAEDPDGDATCDCHQDGRLHAHLIPDGSLIYVDEAWKWFGHLQDATRQATPKHVLGLAEHRHRAIDFVWTTQMPSQIYPFARALIQDHWHVVRRYGTHMIDVYKWGELCEDVKSQAKRELSVKETRTLPKVSFDAYQSATAHTIKAKIPLRILILPLLAVFAIGLAYAAYNYFKTDNVVKRSSLTTEIEAEAAQAAPTRPGHTAATFTDSLPDLLRAQTPLIASQPWTAPMYGGLKPQGAPMIYCISSGLDGVDGCNCITEQGTTYQMPVNQCKLAARNGIYNPNKSPVREIAYKPPVNQVKQQPSQPRIVAGAPDLAENGLIGTSGQGEVW